MIERLKETGGWAFGFKVTGKVTEEDVNAFEPQLKFAIDERKKRPIGILADITEMDSVDLAARWEELHFLHKYSDHITRTDECDAMGRGRLHANRRYAALRRRNALFSP